jgi:hypothetical protein
MSTVLPNIAINEHSVAKYCEHRGPAVRTARLTWMFSLVTGQLMTDYFAEFFRILGYYAASVGLKLTFRYYLSVPYLRDELSKKEEEMHLLLE